MKRRKVSGEAFFKKLQKNAAFLKKANTQKLLSFFQPFPEQSIEKRSGACNPRGCYTIADLFSSEFRNQE